MKPGSGVGVTWHQWFLFREAQARCWETWSRLGPRARPGPVKESRERLSGRLWGQPHPWRRKSRRGGRGRPGDRAAERTRSTEGWDREHGRISPEPPGGRVCAASCRQGAPRSALPTPARRRGEQLGKVWAGCLRSNEAWAPLESALRPALVAPSTRPHGRAGVRTESGGSWGRPGN